MAEVVGEQVLYSGRVFDVVRHKVRLPNGRVSIRDFVKHPGAVAIVAVTSSGEVVLVRQYRHAAGEELLELPAGTLELGEQPIECARRELLEETGYVADELVELFRCFLAPGYSSEVMYFYLAKGLREAEERPEEHEVSEALLLPIDEALKMIERGGIRDSKTVAGLLYYTFFVRDNSSPRR